MAERSSKVMSVRRRRNNSPRVFVACAECSVPLPPLSREAPDSGLGERAPRCSPCEEDLRAEEANARDSAGLLMLGAMLTFLLLLAAALHVK